MDDTNVSFIHLNTQRMEFVLAQFWSISQYRANSSISVVRKRGTHIPAHVLRMEPEADLALISLFRQRPKINNAPPQFVLFSGEVDDG